MGIATSEINAAADGNYNEWSHNGHKGGDDSELHDLLADEYGNSSSLISALADLLEEKFQQSLPEIWKWYAVELPDHDSVVMDKE